MAMAKSNFQIVAHNDFFVFGKATLMDFRGTQLFFHSSCQRTLPRLETNLVALEARGNNKRHFSRKCPSGSYYRLSHSKLETQKLANFHGFSIERFVEV